MAFPLAQRNAQKKKAPSAEAKDAFRDPQKGSRLRPRVGTAAKLLK
jgi:hypothetical protein